MNKSPFGTAHATSAFQVGLLVFTIVVLVSLMADTILMLPPEVSILIHMIDTFGCALFFLDFCFRLYQADSKLGFMKWGWIDLIASIPNLQILRWGRLVRVLRVIRLLRGIRSVQLVLAAVLQDRLRGGLVSVVFGVVLLVSFSSASVLICERQADANIKTAEDALWWSLATITTVGYGDKYPVTTEGRVIGVILMVAGVSMFGCLSGLAASFFLKPKEGKQSEMAEVLVRLDQIQKQLELLGVSRRAAG
jgi:voltage-gated potassium channel